VDTSGDGHDRPRDLVETFWVTDDVERLVAQIGGADVEAVLDHGVAFVWLPDGLRLPDVLGSRVTTYAGDGTVLEEGPALSHPAG
jgi:hypothetical protein